MKRSLKYLLTTCFMPILFSCQSNEDDETTIMAPQWQEVTISFTAQQSYENPYLDIDFWVEFTQEDGQSIKRPGFWDGGNSWKVRFASPSATGTWQYKTFSQPEDAGLHGKVGQLKSQTYTGNNKLLQKGLLRMSSNGRNVIHADGTPFLVVGDTPWALPWRATKEAALAYAKNRKEKGFNTALLMTLCPDRDAEGPRSRELPQGFDRAFEDLPEGHINQPNISYFQFLDTLMATLVAHEIVPVYQPVFNGYGWKGQNLLGWDMEAEENGRFMRYLIARYGAAPALWLVGADGYGKEPGVAEAGMATEQWDAYGQPAGIHYNPFDDYYVDFMDSLKCNHLNMSYQDAPWLDFQWAQTGHDGKHLYHKVERMYDNLPTKGVANGEPTYEGIGRDPGRGAVWWQGQEAWNQLMAGGTMGVVYGAAGLWQWKLFPDEEGWPQWADANVSWEQALHLEGSKYVGFLAKAFEGYAFTDMEKRPDLANGQACLAIPGRFYACYLEEGGNITLSDLDKALPFQWFNPKTGQWTQGGTTQEATETFDAPDSNPWVLFVGEKS